MHIDRFEGGSVGRFLPGLLGHSCRAPLFMPWPYNLRAVPSQLLPVCAEVAHLAMNLPLCVPIPHHALPHALSEKLALAHLRRLMGHSAEGAVPPALTMASFDDIH